MPSILQTIKSSALNVDKDTMLKIATSKEPSISNVVNLVMCSLNMNNQEHILPPPQQSQDLQQLRECTPWPKWRLLKPMM